MSFMQTPPVFVPGLVGTNPASAPPPASTGGFVTASTPPPTTPTSGFAAGLPASLASGSVPSATTGGLASSPIVSSLPVAPGGAGLTRAELLGKQAEQSSGVALGEMSGRDQAGAQLTGVHQTTLLEDASKILNTATLKAYAAAPTSVKNALGDAGFLPPTSTPVSPNATKGPITSAASLTARRASAVLEQAKALISDTPAAPHSTAVGSLPTGSVAAVPLLPTFSTATPTTSTTPAVLAPRAVPQPGDSFARNVDSAIDRANHTLDAATKRASGLFESAKYQIGEITGSNDDRRASLGKQPEGTAPVVHHHVPGAVAGGVLAQVGGLLGGVVQAVKTELGGQVSRTGVSAPVVAAVQGGSLPSQEKEGARAFEASGGVGALPGGAGESGVAVLPLEKANPLAETPASVSGAPGLHTIDHPVALKSPEESVAPVSGEGASVPTNAFSAGSTTSAPAPAATNTTSAPHLAPALGGFVAASPVAAAIGSAIDAKPVEVVPVHSEEKTRETGTPALPLGSLTNPGVDRTSSLASVTAIRHGDAGDLHGHKGAAIGLETPSSVSGSSSLKDSAPGLAANGVGSTINNSTPPTTSAALNGSVDKTTANSEPHAAVPEKFAAVGHVTPESPASAGAARAAEAHVNKGSAVEGKGGHKRGESGSSTGKKSGFLSKIKAKLHHDKE